MIIKENAGKVTVDGKFPCGVCKRVHAIGDNCILCHFCSCWVHKRCSGIRV